MPASIIDLFRRKGLEPKKKTATEWSSPCPNCGGKDRCNIWPDDQEGKGYYWCRQCGVQGDGIQLLRDFFDMTYAEACKEIGVSVNPNYAPPRRAPGANHREMLEPKTAGETAKGIASKEGRDLWREKATAFAKWAHARLLERPSALAWLQGRGLPLSAVRRYGLGWNVGEKGKNYFIRPRESWGLSPETKKNGKPQRLWIPGGLVIPHLGKTAEGVFYVRRLRIRRTDEDRARFNPDQKYYIIPGSEMDMLYLPCGAENNLGVIVVVESELDALLLHHLAGDMVGVLSAMTSTVKKIPAPIFSELEQATCILVALDFDEADKEGNRAGAEGWPRWNETFAHAKRWPVPAGKDPGEAFERGEDLRLWLKAGIPAGLRLLMTPSPCPAGVREKEAALNAPLPGLDATQRTTPAGKNEAGTPKEPPTTSPDYSNASTRWQGATAATPLAEAVLPAGCSYTVAYLRQTFAGRSDNPALLVPCPKTRPTAWYWKYRRDCAQCLGHPQCLLDFLLSPQMFAPLETQLAEPETHEEMNHA